NQGDLWVTTAGDAVRYRRGRDACAHATVSGDTVLFDSASPVCLRFATTLTYFLQSLYSVQGTVTAHQQGTPRAVVALGAGSFMVDADPSGGPLVLSVQP